jgi:hypothetical protein
VVEQVAVVATILLAALFGLVFIAIAVGFSRPR